MIYGIGRQAIWKILRQHKCDQNVFMFMSRHWITEKKIICCRLRSYVYVSAACHVIILFYSASLHRWCILLHVSSWGCTREKGINLKFELQGTKTSLIQTLHVIMLHGSISASETIDSLSSGCLIQIIFSTVVDVFSCGGYCARWPLMCCKKIIIVSNAIKFYKRTLNSKSPHSD